MSETTAKSLLRGNTRRTLVLGSIGAILIVWIILKGIMGIRVSEENEMVGLDTSELGMEAYPEFAKG